MLYKTPYKVVSRLCVIRTLLEKQFLFRPKVSETLQSIRYMLLANNRNNRRCFATEMCYSGGQY